MNYELEKDQVLYFKKPYVYEVLASIIKSFMIGDKVKYAYQSHTKVHLQDDTRILFTIKHEEMDLYLETLHQRRKRIIKEILNK